MTTTSTPKPDAGNAPRVRSKAEIRAERPLCWPKESPGQLPHSPLPWALEGAMKITSGIRYVTNCFVEGSSASDIPENKANADFIVHAVNSYPAAQAMAEALEAWIYARDEGGISMVDWFQVAVKKTEAALQAWKCVKPDGHAPREAQKQ